MTRQQFQRAIAPIVGRVRERLQQLGYSPTDNQMSSFRMTVLPLIALVLVFGMTKVAVGAERHHQVGFLIVLLILTALFGLVLCIRPTRTRAGRDFLRSYLALHHRAARAPLDDELPFAGGALRRGRAVRHAL